MRKIYALLAAILMLAPPQAFAAEVVKRFDSIVSIERDGSLTVEENLLVDVENRGINHGIIRRFPVLYKDGEGRAVEVGFDVLSAKIDGRDAPCSVSYDGAYALAHIGDPKRTVPCGERLFTLKYRTTRQIGFFDTYDELYWNVTGDEWQWPIFEASCRVSLPDGEAFDSVEWYVGRRGLKGKRGDAERSGKGTVVTTRPLAPGEGLTVVYTWKKGLIDAPPPLYGNELAQRVAACGTFALSCMWLCFAVLRSRRGRRHAVIARFYPPDGVSPAYVRYIKKFVSDNVSLSANIIGLAVKGALTIEEKREESFFSRKSVFSLVKRDVRPFLTKDEEALMDGLFSQGTYFEVGKKSAKRLYKASVSMRHALSALGRGLAHNGAAARGMGALIVAAGVAVSFFFAGEKLDTLILSAVMCAVVLVPGLARHAVPVEGLLPILSVAAPPLASAAACMAASVSVSDGDQSALFIILPYIAAATAASLVSVAAAHRTEEGERLAAEVAGLELYITVAEKGRLEMLNAPDDTPETFERILPYAVALGAADTWGARFAGVLEKAQYSPLWYNGPSPFIFMSDGGRSFSSAVGKSAAGAMSGLGKVPGASSGAGGRGSAGGGGGGGGGSGW